MDSQPLLTPKERISLNETLDEDAFDYEQRTSAKRISTMGTKTVTPTQQTISPSNSSVMKRLTTSARQNVQFQAKLSKAPIKQAAQSDSFKTSFTMWDRVQIVLVHLIEPTLVGLMIGFALQMSEVPTILYLSISLLVLLPLILTETLSKIRLKRNLTWVLICLAPAFLLLKAWIYCQFTPTPGISKESAEFLGVYQSFWAKTFVIDIVIFTLACLLAVCYYYQISQLEQKVKLQGSQKYQLKVKFFHVLFGESASKFYNITFTIYILDTLLFQTVTEGLFTLIQFAVLYKWATSKKVAFLEMSLRAMQILGFILLAFQFILGFPLLFDDWINDHTKLMEVFGLGTLQQSPTLTSAQVWFTRVHMLVLTYAIVLTEVYFVAKHVCQQDQQKKDNAAALQTHKSSSFETQLKPRFQSKKKPRNWIEQVQYLFEFSKQSLALWTCRFVCFIQVYMYHDYQSLVFLVWLLGSSVYTNTKIFVKITYFVLFPLMMLTYVFYFVVNIFGLFNYSAWTNQPKYYTYGFYQMTVPILELGLAYFNLVAIAVWMRLVNQSEETPVEPIDTKLESTTLYQLCYLLIININYIVFLFLIMSGLAKMDLYHVVMLFVFVWAALYPAAFQRHVIWVLLYADFFVLGKYIFTLVQTKPTSEFTTQWYTIVGIASTYNPDSTKEYFRYPPKFDQWVLVLLTFIEYRRSNLLGSDLAQIKKTEGKIHKQLQQKYPTTTKLIRSLSIVYSHIVVISAFIVYIMVLLLIRISVLNAISLIILLSLLLAYLNKGLKLMLTRWTLFQYWTAFVLLSSLAFQFLAITQTGIKLYSLLSSRTQSYLFFIGYEVFTSRIWYYFLPYAAMFYFSILLKESFAHKVSKEDKDLTLSKSDQTLLQQETITDDSQAILHSSSNLETVLQRRRAENSERCYDMQCKLSFLIWKAKWGWPLFDLVAQYFHVGVAVSVFAYALYFQIALLWLAYVAFYLFCTWRLNSANTALSLSELQKFKTEHKEYVDSQLQQRVNKLRQFQLNESEQVESICEKIITESKANNCESIMEPRLLLTDQEAVQQCEVYQTKLQKQSLDSRQSLWLIQFVLAIITVALMYLSVFITAEYINPAGHSEMVIQNIDTQNFTIFLAFVSGFFRRSVGSVTNHQTLMDNLYPIILFMIILTFEKICIMWLEDRLGTSDQVMKLYTEIESQQAPKQSNASSTIRVDQHDSFLYNEIEEQSEFVDLDETSEKIEKKQINTRLSQLVNVKINVMVSRAAKILVEELIILMVWFSAVYKQNILSLLLMLLLVLHTYSKQKAVQFIVTFVILYQYLVAVLSLSSYSSPIEFPPQIVNQTYPSAQYNYLYVPFYYNLTSQLHGTTNVSTEEYQFFSVNITSRKLNGVWLDLVTLILLAISMSSYSHWLISTPHKICSSLETQRLLKQYTRHLDYDPTFKELKMEIKRQTIFNRAVLSACESLYTNFGLLMIAVILFISIFSKSLLCFGYFIFSMMLIFNFRLILQDPTAHGSQLYILSWLVPYLLLDVLVMWLMQYPYGFYFNETQTKYLGVYKVWDIYPNTIEFGVNENVSVSLVFGFGELFAKGIAYFVIQLQIHLLKSEGYKQFSQKILIDNVKYATAIGTGMAYRQNNYKNQLVLMQAQDYGNLERMLSHVKDVIASRGDVKKPAVEVIDEVNEDADDFQTQFKQQVERAYKAKIQALPKATKLYLWMRRNYVDDMLCKLSTDQMLDIIEQFRNGRTSIRTSIEVGAMLQVKTQVLQSMLEDLKSKGSEQIAEFELFMQNELLIAQPLPWERVNLAEYDSTTELIKNYVSMLWKITASNTHFMCYFFMLVCAISNGGFIYMVYPCLVFGVALLQASRPGKQFWYFVIVYTQAIIILQFTCQLSFWDGLKITKAYTFSEEYNVGLVYIDPLEYSFKIVLKTFYAEILVMTFVLIHIQSETKAGLLNVKLSEFETFTEGLDRYIRLVVLVNNAKALQEYESILDHKILKGDELEYSVLSERRYSLPTFNQQQDLDQTIDLDSEVLIYGIDALQIEQKHYSLVDSKELQELVQQIEEKRLKEQGLSVFTKIKKALRFAWDSEFLNDLFPIIRQQKPGKDLYVYFVAVCIFLFAYIFLFYPKMTSQSTTPAEQIQSSQLQAPMVFSIIAIIGFMFFDRIFYSIYALIGIESMKEKLQPAEQTVVRSNSLAMPLVQGVENNHSHSRRFTNRNNSVMVGERRQHQFNDVSQVDLQQTDTIDYLNNNQHQSQQAYFKSLVPKYQTKTVFRVAKFYYFWFLIIVAHWYVFFFLVKQPPTCGYITPYCNKVGSNGSLLFFYLVVCVYLALQAYQIQLGLPELKKGGFMLGNFSPLAKVVFEVWYYIPFLFELRTIIDWTFTKTALDVFQSIKLAQVQSDMYIAKCSNKSYKEKQLGSQVNWPTKVIFGGGLLLFVFALIIVPMLLFSNLNPIAVYNPVTSATLSFAITIINKTAAGQQVNIPMFETTQVTKLQNLTASQFEALGFSNQTSDQTNIFKPIQTQAIQFSPVSDMVWSITPPKVSLLLNALNYSMYNTDPAIQVYAEIKSDFKRLQTQAPTASIAVQLPLTSQNTDVQSNLIQMIQCSETVNSTVFPTYSTSLLFILQASTTRQIIQNPNITSGANLTYYCNNATNSSNYWSLTQVFATDSILYQTEEEIFNIDSGFGIFVFNQTLLPASLAAYSSSLIVFYVTIVYLIASSFRSGFVPLSYQIFISDSVMTEDIIMICQCVYIYRVQRDLEKEEEMFMILMDIMRSPETLKSITGTSLKKKID